MPNNNINQQNFGSGDNHNTSEDTNIIEDNHISEDDNIIEDNNQKIRHQPSINDFKTTQNNTKAVGGNTVTVMINTVIGILIALGLFTAIYDLLMPSSPEMELPTYSEPQE